MLVGVTAVYASTERGFQRLWLPLARTLLDGEVEAESGRLDLRGRLEVRGLRVRSAALDADVAHGVVDVDPLALPPWRRPQIDTLVLESARLTLHEGGEADAEPEDETAGADDGGGLPDALRPIPVRVIEASLRDVVVASRGADAETPRWRVGVAQARIGELAPGTRGALALQSDWELADVPEALRRGRIVLDVDVDEAVRPEDPATPPAPAAVTLRGDVEIGASDGGAAAFRVTAEGSGTLDEAYHVALERLALEVFEQGRPLVTAQGSGTLSPREGRADLEVAADAEPVGDLLARVPLPEGLASLLAPADAALRARVRVEPGTTAVDGSARFEGLAETPDLPASLDLAARLAVDEGAVEIEAFSLRGLDAAGGEREAVSGSGRIAPGETPVVALDLEGDAVPAAAWLGRFDVVLPPSYGPVPLQAALRLEIGDEGGSVEGEGTLRVAAASHPDLARDAVFRLGRVATRWGPETLHVEVEGEGPGAGEDGAGRLQLRLDREADGARPRIATEARLAGLDATALVPRGPESDAEEDVVEEAADEVEEAATSPQPFRLGLPVDVEAELALDGVVLRGLHVDRLRARARTEAERLDLDAEGEGVSGGTLALDFERAVEAEEARTRWTLRAEELQLEPLIRAFAGGSELVSGRLDLESEGEGRAPAATADLLSAAEGRVDFRLRDGHAEGLRVQEVAAARAGLRRLLTLDVSQAQGSFPIREGVLRLEDVQVDGDLVHFHIDGTLDMRRVDVMVNPRLGPDLAAGSGLTNLLFAPASSLVALPFVVTVRGPLDATRIGVRPATPALLGDVVGLAGDAAVGTLNGVRGLAGGEEGSPAPPPPVGAPTPGDGTGTTDGGPMDGGAQAAPDETPPSPEAGAPAREGPAAPSPAPSP